MRVAASVGEIDSGVNGHRPKLMILPTPDAEVSLASYAEQYGKAERTLFNKLAAGDDAGKLKPSFMKEHSLTGRQFNAMAFSIKGKIKSLIAVGKLRIKDLQERICSLEYKLSEKLKPGTNKYHQKKRRLSVLRGRLAALEQDRKDGELRMCFGSHKLFGAQFNLEANGYKDHAAWKEDWEKARSREFFVLGSKDETAGCQGCQMTHLDRGLFSVKLRLPNTEEDNKFVSFHEDFSYGVDAILVALASGKALSFRFQRDLKGWRMFVLTNVAGGPPIRLEKGAVDVDLNEDHLAVTETDASCNPVSNSRIPLITYGCTTDQARDRIGVAVKQIIEIAVAARKPLAIKKMDFVRKKQELKDGGAKYARMLFSLSYSLILSTIKARAFDRGISVTEVNLAFTSVIGRYKFSCRYGLSSHSAAALVIARRSLQLSERPNPHSGHGTSRVPEWNRGKHAWSFWARILRGERRF